MKRIGVISRGAPPGSHVIDRWRFDVLIRLLNSRELFLEYYREGERYDILIIPVKPDHEPLVGKARQQGALVIGDVTDDLLADNLNRMLPPYRLTLVGKLYLRLQSVFDNQTERVVSMIRSCDAVVTGSAAQADSARRHNPRVYAITDSILENRFHRAGQVRDRRPLKLVWIGNVQSLGGLASIRRALDRLGSDNEYELVLITGSETKGKFFGRRPRNAQEFIEDSRIRCEFRQWTIETFDRDLALGDVGIVPTSTADAFTLNKPPGRALLLMAAGLPVVATPIRSHKEVITHGENGFLASSTDDWVRELRRLAREPELRRALSIKGREFALRDYGEAAFAEKYREVIKAVLG